jgi:hypothetical protein
MCKRIFEKRTDRARGRIAGFPRKPRSPPRLAGRQAAQAQPGQVGRQSTRGPRETLEKFWLGARDFSGAPRGPVAVLGSPPRRVLPSKRKGTALSARRSLHEDRERGAALFGDGVGSQPLWMDKPEKSVPRSTHEPAGQSVWPRRGRVSASESTYRRSTRLENITWVAGCASWVAIFGLHSIKPTGRVLLLVLLVELLDRNQPSVPEMLENKL